ncbi:alpha/beta fold hydrolase [Planctomyces sp. SH-PL14]|uniref:alpha/beta fold hydrolase n=1 Tax=Planctomyces sp. SH-PL14 TaxID=1632864 RepID=UPI00078D094C|nr:alpha/beta hydrolase [Planctomyces sp. SH-PL14]AMV16456.1 Non-heme chloroperoxidase [Planctomyces sp. SH-PL14]
MQTPASVLFVWLRLILAIMILGGGAWALHAWYHDVTTPVPILLSPDPVGFADATLPPRVKPGPPRGWQPGWNRQTGLLVLGSLLLLFSFGGSWINPRLWLQSGEPVPELAGGTSHRLRRDDGTELFIEIFGPDDGPTVIATHGWGTDRREWTYVRHRCPGARLVVWDLPGCGRSTRAADDDYSLEKFARDLRAVIDVSGVTPVALMGHSIGGMTILTFCRLFPDLLGSRVSGLVLAHTTYKNPVRTMPFSGLLTAIERPLIIPLLYLQILLSPIVWLSNCLSYLNGSVHWSNTSTGFGGTESAAKLDFVSRYSLQNSRAVLARGCLGMLDYDATATLPMIKIPTLIIAGEQDPVTPRSASDVIAQGVRDSTLKPLNPAKHYGFLEHDGDFADALLAFCSRGAEAGKPVTVPA